MLDSLFSLSEKITFVFIIVLTSFFCSAGLTYAVPSGRFGVALGTWNYDLLQCYSISGVKEVDCRNAYNQYYRKGFNDMLMTTYDLEKHKLAASAFNISSLAALDPLANTQFIWFHYEETEDPIVVPSGEFNYGVSRGSYPRLGRSMTTDELVYPVDANGLRVPGSEGAEIYATSGAPGSVSVKVQKEQGTNINNRGFGWRIRLPKLIYKNGYPFCDGCIFKESDFMDFLQQNVNFNDGNGNWYAFYMLAEVEYGIISHYLEPREYAAVINEYVEKISSRFPNARFVLSSPVAGVGFRNRYEPYYAELYSASLLTPQAKNAIAFNSADVFVGPQSKPDTAYQGYAAVTDQELQNLAYSSFVDAFEVGNFFYRLNGKPTLLTQSGVRLYPAIDPPLNSLTFGSGVCSWCQNNNDVWQTTQFGNARLLQLFYGNLLLHSNETHVAAWAYWGNARQENWVEPLINKTWGDLNHGIFWLTWPLICNAGNGCPVTTDQIWPSHSGMEYLKLANGVLDYRPSGAPSWWPNGQIASFPTPTPNPSLFCFILGNIDCFMRVDSFDLSLLVDKIGLDAPGAKEDLDNSLKTNSLDLAILINNYGK